VAPSLDYGAYATNLFSEGRRTYRAGLRYAGATLTTGRPLSDWGDVQVGISRNFSRATLLIPEDPHANVGRFYDTTRFANLTIDTLDSVAFPSRGQLLKAGLQRSTAHDLEVLTQAAVIGLAAFGKGEWAGHVYVEWSRSNLGGAPQPLGGFLRLSGTTPDSLDARTVAFGRLVAARRIGDMPTAFGEAVRLGFSLELGGGFRARQPVHMPDLKQAGSVFVAAGTRFGPLYLGTGATRGTGGTLYLFLGPIW
jgi:NTE family protein